MEPSQSKMTCRLTQTPAFCKAALLHDHYYTLLCWKFQSRLLCSSAQSLLALNCSEKINPSIFPILQPQVFHAMASSKISVEGKLVKYNDRNLYPINVWFTFYFEIIY